MFGAYSVFHTEDDFMLRNFLFNINNISYVSPLYYWIFLTMFLHFPRLLVNWHLSTKKRLLIGNPHQRLLLIQICKMHAIFFFSLSLDNWQMKQKLIQCRHFIFLVNNVAMSFVHILYSKNQKGISYYKYPFPYQTYTEEIYKSLLFCNQYFKTILT